MVAAAGWPERWSAVMTKDSPATGRGGGMTQGKRRGERGEPQILYFPHLPLGFKFIAHFHMGCYVKFYVRLFSNFFFF